MNDQSIVHIANEMGAFCFFDEKLQAPGFRGKKSAVPNSMLRCLERLERLERLESWLAFTFRMNVSVCMGGARVREELVGLGVKVLEGFRRCERGVKGRNECMEYEMRIRYLLVGKRGGKKKYGGRSGGGDLWVLNHE